MAGRRRKGKRLLTFLLPLKSKCSDDEVEKIRGLFGRPREQYRDVHIYTILQLLCENKKKAFLSFFTGTKSEQTTEREECQFHIDFLHAYRLKSEI